MYDTLLSVVALALLGALCAPKTVLHTFAITFDVLVQAVFWNKPVPITISSRAGLAARLGNKRAASVVNYLARNPNHCEEAIAGDIARAHEALAILIPKR